MSSSAAIDVLGELLVIHFRSFPQYLAATHAWMERSEDEAVEVIRNIVADQQTYCTRLADMIQRRGGRIDQGDFPMDYTDTHDLGLDFIIGKLLREQKRDLELIENCRSRLAADVPGTVLAEEALGAAQAHLDALEELESSRMATS
ncbi:MAG: hypothetical protein DWQ31_07265 [Planctomycetota bacterium]|nr:MAG: hypothetical protein DWQ31_07265 [Planctomycetota bacterium]REJ92201.1 MAG: hypothetical protein DWQ35_12590 [Planctomycetota bacterium]REK25499.1 MAG: hypothetical protein DWQ42_11375 [Planctomycetota bacterium]REK45933.1 MAG: hypothetical protein DWQ46_07865 [Planctomycetota bacterium]